ncbi:hypothetical protein DMENIID0001_092330 [Sergentomyia squamirostris]
MTTAIEDHIMDTKLSTLWLWGEFIGVILVLCLLVVIISVGRLQNAVPLNRFKKSRILITNGSSLLSRELHHQLTVRHQCQVVLVSESKESPRSAEKFDLTNGNVVNLNCNTMCHQQMNSLAEYVWNELGAVDAIIDIEEELHTDDVCDVVQQTGTNIQRFLNLIANFAPKMHQSGGGQVVTIRSNLNAAGACLSTRSNVFELLQQLTQTQSPNIELSTVFLNKHGRTFNVGGLMNLLGVSSELTMAEVAAHIIRGLQSGKDILEIKTRRSLIDFIAMKLKKQDNTDLLHNYNISTSLKNCQ